MRINETEIQEIIDGLPESRRKRALVEVARDGLAEREFWKAVRMQAWSAVSTALEQAGRTVYADAVWEG